MSNNFHVAYILNSTDCYMLMVSMYSVIKNNIDHSITFHLIIDEFFEKELTKPFKIFDKYNNISINWIRENHAKFTSIKNKVDFNKEFYCFNLYNKIAEDKILYLNENTIINTNLSELYNTPLDGYSCAAPEYLYPQCFPNDFDVKKDIAFNNTILLIDLNQWRRQNIFEKLLYYNYSNVAHLSKANHIVCFNIIINDCKKLDYKYGYTEANKLWCGKIPIKCSNDSLNMYKQILLHVENPFIVEYVVQNPLTSPDYTNSYTTLWWKYAEQSPIYDQIKEFRQLNKYKLSATSAVNSFKYSWLLGRIFPYIKPYLFRIFLGFAIAIPLGLLDGVTAFALKPYMDYVIGGKSLDLNLLNYSLSLDSLAMAFIIPVGVILFAAIQGGLRYLNDYISAWTSQKITNDVKFDLFHRLIHMHPQFFDDNSSGIVISRYMGDPGTASAGIIDQIKSITTDICGALGLIAVMIYSSWKLAFIGVLVLFIAFIPVAILRKRIKEASNKNMVIGGNITTNINETYSGNKVMAAYGLQDRQENYFKNQVLDSFDINMSLTKRAAWMSPMMYLIASCGIATVLGYGTYLISTGKMTAGSFASFVTSLLLLYKPVKGLGGTLAGIQNIFVAMGRIFELFDLEPNIKEAETTIEMNELNQNIKFEDVNFEYVPNKPVLKNLNMEIIKNETLAIVGNSGGGKSTLVNLLPRFYNVKSGVITIDGIDIKDFSIKSLRKNISMVFQDNFLYSGSIKDNIMMGNPDASVEELMQAIQSAHLQDMVQALPDGLDTMLGERGLTLSGGQRQRVAIARAMLRNAPIVILDEATSALDNESEAIVQKAMDNLMQNRTVFIIAHRLSTIKNADRIAVINEGELVELGSHEKLIKIKNGQYKHLYEMQFKNQEETLLT